MEFKDLIKTKRVQLNKTLEEVGKAVGVSKATVQRWESGEIKNVRRDKILNLANALELSPEQLMGWEEVDKQVSIFSYDNIIPLPKTNKIPLIGTIACGMPIFAEENIEDYIELSSDIRADFCLRCKGDSMINARIFDGDIVFVHQQPDVENGQIGVVLIENQATLKRVYKQRDSLLLQAENPLFAPIIISGEALNQVIIQGRAVAFMSSVR